MIRHLPEPSIDHRSDVRDAPDFEGLTREAYTHLLDEVHDLRISLSKSEGDHRDTDLKYRRLLAATKGVSRDSFDECRDYAWVTIGEDELRKLVIDAVNAGGRKDLLGGGPIYVVIDTPRSFKVDAGKGSEVFPVKASRVDAPDRSGVAYEIEMG